MKVLVACELSGVVREAFRAKGHDAVSCDLCPTIIPGPHIQGDVLAILNDGWDLMIAHPPCTYLSRAGARWWKDPERQEKAEEAFRFVMALWEAPIPRIAIENPVGKLNQMWRYPDQTIEPYYFGEPYRKRTCLWLKSLPPLISTEMVIGATYWIDTGTTRGVARTPRLRSITFVGVARAMADQWG